MQLSKDQENIKKEFIKFIFNKTENEMVIQGHAGTGKSFLVKELTKALQKIKKLRQLLTSEESGKRAHIYYTTTTNKAASILSGIIKDFPVTTIHSLLKLKVFNNYKTGKATIRTTRDFVPYPDSLLIIDEASMVNSDLYRIIKKTCKDIKILYIMDSYQLTPVGENSCPVIENVKNIHTLNTIHRQAKGNKIIDLAERYRKVLDGENFPNISNYECSTIKRLDGPSFQNEIDNAFKNNPQTGYRDSKILAWTNNVVIRYNDYVRSLHTNTVKPIAGEMFSTNKPLLAFNGDIILRTDTIFKIHSVDPSEHNYKNVRCWKIWNYGNKIYIPIDRAEYKRELMKAKRKGESKKGWDDYFKLKDTIADIRPIHASTVHKSQGSTYDKVFINLDDIGCNRRPHEVARLMYVALTRAAKEVVLFGHLGVIYGDPK